MIRPPRRHRTKDAYSRIPNPVRRVSLRLLDGLDILVYALVGLAFIGSALLALGYSLVHLLARPLLNFGVALPVSGVVQNVLDFVSDLLLVLIIMEVLGTVRSYLEKGDTSVKPFLFIGIISATRGILSIGARLSIQTTTVIAGTNSDEFRNSMIELAIDAIVIIALGATIRIMGNAADQPDEAEAASTTASDGRETGFIERVTVETTLPGHQAHPAVQPDAQP